VTDRALDELVSGLREGVTERAVARRFADLVLAHGGDGLAFDTIVASGPNASVPHHSPTDRPLGRGDLVVLDLGARVDGYCADMTRTVVVGAPDEWQSQIHQAVHEAQRNGVDAVRPGAVAGAVDAAARSAIERAGFGDRFVHSTGHGIGLQVHEAPLLGAGSTGRIEQSSIVTVEPGIYLPGRGGVRIEDTVLVGPDGAVPLTTTPRDLLVVG
jgi:Xaa-Pro aminopeptidase